jgi:hypothetical protein
MGDGGKPQCRAESPRRPRAAVVDRHAARRRRAGGVWALEQLRERTMPQNAILDEFNKRLADRGIAKVSKSSWSRYAVRKAIQFRKLDEVQRMSGELVASLGTDGPDQVTVAVAEMLKLAMFQTLEKGELDSKGLMELSRALSSAVGAQKTSGRIPQEAGAGVANSRLRRRSTRPRRWSARRGSARTASRSCGANSWASADERARRR